MSLEVTAKVPSSLRSAISVVSKCVESELLTSTQCRHSPNARLTIKEGENPMYKIMLGVVLLSVVIEGHSSEDPSIYPNSRATYEEVNNEVGCNSKYSDEKKNDIFKSKYKNHWVTWQGEVVLAKSDRAAINIDGKGIQDLAVDFSDDKAGYDLIKGNNITVRFVMRSAGGCFLPFSGDYATMQ